jgi:hypothetical protein
VEEESIFVRPPRRKRKRNCKFEAATTMDRRHQYNEVKPPLPDILYIFPID